MGNERGGGHTVGAREGQQYGQGPRPCSREGARRGWQTNTFAWGPTLLREDQHYLHYITIVTISQGYVCAVLLLVEEMCYASSGLSA